MVRICSYNCPGQIVIGGEADAVARAGELAKAAGARRLLPARQPAPTRRRCSPPPKRCTSALGPNPSAKCRFPVLFNCSRPGKGSETIPSLLERQVVSPVMMEDTLRELARLGVDTFVEIGPGTALSGFVRKTLAHR
ncbi:MAG: ACP S-malonyltransferase [Christensenellales bacterium]